MKDENGDYNCNGVVFATEEAFSCYLHDFMQEVATKSSFNYLFQGLTRSLWFSISESGIILTNNQVSKVLDLAYEQMMQEIQEIKSQKEK